MVSSKELKERVSEVYAERIQEASSCCDDGVAVEIYSSDALEGLPDGVASFGCGNPVALASLKLGQMVVDLGSGAGLDCFLGVEGRGAGWSRNRGGLYSGDAGAGAAESSQAGC